MSIDATTKNPLVTIEEMASPLGSRIAGVERVVPEMREPDVEDTSRISDRPPAPSEMIH
ncbi:MAG: hypothetical protein GY854_06425 [Deltaproteobacteria bacterium]|nr:hypothetical protein [Deltaproteobacteria bacterium]